MNTEGQQRTSKRHEDIFRWLIFLVVFGYNVFFVCLWVQRFVLVLIRLHFEKIKWVLGLCKVKIKYNIDNYETNLTKMLTAKSGASRTPLEWSPTPKKEEDRSEQSLIAAASLRNKPHLL